MPTIRDVAARAGVSPTTVSRVLNNRGYLSSAVRAKVAQAMKELDYQPNDLARSLFKRQSFLIGLIVPSLAHPFFGELARYIEENAYAQGYKIIVCNSLDDAEKEREYIDMLRRSQVDGIIMGSHLLNTREYQAMKGRIISLDRKIAPDIPFIACDNAQGGRLAAKELLSRGCRRLVHISGSLKVPMLSNRRTTAFVEACKAAGADCRSYELPDASVVNFHEDTVIADIMLDNPDCDGVFCTNDMSAAAVLLAAARLKRMVPDDIKVIGFDGTLISQFTTPQLSTIRQPIEAISRHAVNDIAKMSKGEIVPNQTILPVEFVYRGTT